MKKNKKYLVTGAAGFIGSKIAKKLLERGSKVWTIDNLSTGFADNIPNEVEYLYGNCFDEKIVNKLKNVKFDAIVHFAGQSSGEISFEDPVYDLRTNTESTLRLINYGLNNNCNRFIYASTMSVYGKVPDIPINENHITKPISFYGIGKLASENYLHKYSKRGLIPTTLRIFNVYGPGQNLGNMKQGMVSIYLSQMIKNKSIIVKGSKKRFRDFIHVDDVVKTTIKSISKENSFNKIYNVGTGIKLTVEELLEKLIEAYGENISIKYDKPTPGDQFGIYSDNRLLKKDLNVESFIDFKKGIKDMLNWAIHHEK